MNHSVRLTEEADRDLTAAALWYELHRTGLGHEFLDELGRVLGSIAARPVMYPVVWRQSHRALVNRFPFGIYYRIEGGIAVVVAVIHGSRSPRSWQKREK